MGACFVTTKIIFLHTLYIALQLQIITLVFSIYYMYIIKSNQIHVSLGQYYSSNIDYIFIIIIELISLTNLE